jgi:hypothetical protein
MPGIDRLERAAAARVVLSGWTWKYLPVMRNSSRSGRVANL